MSRVDEGAIVVPDVDHKIFTLVMVRDYERGRVLLGEKLRGFGTGCVVKTFLGIAARHSTARGARGARFVDEEREKAFVGRSCRRIRNRARPPTPREPRLTIDARFSNGRYYNGFGGKVEPGETIEEAALRELKEEAGIDALDMTARGVLRFIFDDNPTPWLVHVFHASKYGGEIEASDEMRPVWFDLKDVPFDSMWADDPHWWPYLLQEKKFVGTFTFTQTTTLVEYWIRESDDLSDV